MIILSGVAFAKWTSSGIVLTEYDGFAAATIGPRAIVATGAMSPTTVPPPLRLGLMALAGVIKRSVCPSGDADATVWAAIELAAPTRFSTITGWLSRTE